MGLSHRVLRPDATPQKNCSKKKVCIYFEVYGVLNWLNCWHFNERKVNHYAQGSWIPGLSTHDSSTSRGDEILILRQDPFSRHFPFNFDFFLLFYSVIFSTHTYIAHNLIRWILKVQPQTTDTLTEHFFQKSKTFGLGQPNWAEILWGIQGIFGQTISICFALWVLWPWVNVSGSFYYKKLWFLGLKYITPK